MAENEEIEITDEDVAAVASVIDGIVDNLAPAQGRADESAAAAAPEEAPATSEPAPATAPAASAASDTAGRPKVDQQLLLDVIDAIRPSFQADGGDLELIGCDENGVVTIEMVGACAGCMFAASDITQGIDSIIKEHVPGVTAVRPVMY